MYVQKGWISMQNDPVLATFDTTPSLHWRINAAGLILAFVHIHGEAGTPAVGIPECGGESERSCSMYVQKGWISMQNDPIFTAFDTTPSLHWRINAAGLILAFAYIHGEAGPPTVGIRSVVVSRNGPVLCAERVDFHAKRPHSHYIRHHPVSALANQCSWFDYGLRPHPWRGGNTNCGHPECGGESERSCSIGAERVDLFS
jgi:hypothetical protein